MSTGLAVCWTACILFFLYGLTPVRIPVEPPLVDAPNRIVVEHHVCTCCANFDVVRGELIVPSEFKENLNTREVTVTGDSPFAYVGNDNPESFFEFLYPSQFILEGKMVGVEDVGPECGNGKRPIFEVRRWSMTKYCSRVWVLRGIWYGLYLLGLPVAGLVLSTITIVRFLRRRNRDR
jgi:hypothetical protein